MYTVAKKNRKMAIKLHTAVAAACQIAATAVCNFIAVFEISFKMRQKIKREAKNGAVGL